MLYRHRKMAAAMFVLLILALGYLFDLRGLQDNYNEIMANENTLHQTVSAAQAALENPRKKIIKQGAATLLQSELLSMFSASQAAVETVAKVEAPPNGAVNDEYYQFTISSNYQQLLQLLKRLQESSMHFMLRRINIQARANGVLQTDMILHASTAGSHHANIQAAPAMLSSPFCAVAGYANEREDQANQMQMFNISQLIFLGTITSQGKTNAIILFPNGVIREAEINMILGREKGVITSITASTVTVSLSAHQYYQIKME